MTQKKSYNPAERVHKGRRYEQAVSAFLKEKLPNALIDTNSYLFVDKIGDFECDICINPEPKKKDPSNLVIVECKNYKIRSTLNVADVVLLKWKIENCGVKAGILFVRHQPVNRLMRMVRELGICTVIFDPDTHTFKPCCNEEILIDLGLL